MNWKTDLYTYNNATYPGMPLTHTDPNGGSWSYAYDNWGNETSETSPGSTNQILQHSYDSTAHLLPVTKTVNAGGAGQVFTTTYHTTGTNPDFHAVSTSVNSTGTPTNSLKYDANGNVISQTNGISGGSSSLTTDKTFTDGGLMVTKTEPYLNDSYNTFALSYTYDSMGRRSIFYNPVDIGNYGHYLRRLRYYYNYQGNLGQTEIAENNIYSSAITFNYYYDSANRLQSQTNSSNTATATVTRNNLGEEIQRRVYLPLFSSYVTSFNIHRRVDGLTDQLVRSDSTSTYNYTMNYTFGTCSVCMGQVIQQTQLSDLGGQVRRETYNYDKNGNRIQHDSYDSGDNYASGEALNYNAANALTTVNYYGPSHVLSRTQDFTAQKDASGNLTKALGATYSATSYVESYYADGKLKSIADGGTYNETSGYDGDGLLATSGNMMFSYDDGDSTCDWQDGWGVEERYKGLLYDARIRSWYDGNFTYDEFNYVHYDPNGSVAVVTDDWPEVVEYYTSDLFGSQCVPVTSAHNYLARDGVRYRPSPNVYQTSTGGAYDPSAGNNLSYSSFAYITPPWHPAPGVETKCHGPNDIDVKMGHTTVDTITSTTNKMNILEQMIITHMRWDWFVPKPNGGNRHKDEIKDLWIQYAHCINVLYDLADKDGGITNETWKWFVWLSGI